MTRTITILLAGLIGLAPAAARAQQPAAAAETRVLSVHGGYVGTAKFTQTPEGVLIEAEISGLTPGEHGLHINEVGSCDPSSGFNTAGRHQGSDLAPHGTMAAGGPHLGDLPNQTVGADGKLRIRLVAPKLTLSDTGPGALLDADEASLVIDEKPDDNRSQPLGASGKRMACALITRAR